MGANCEGSVWTLDLLTMLCSYVMLKLTPSSITYCLPLNLA